MLFRLPHKRIPEGRFDCSRSVLNFDDQPSALHIVECILFLGAVLAKQNV